MVRYVGRLATMLALGVLFAAPVAGQQMTGMWQIEFEGPPGPLQVPIEFAQEGSELTGFVFSPCLIRLTTEGQRCCATLRPSVLFF